MAIRTCVDLGVFPTLSEKQDLSAREIAERTGADEILIRKLDSPLPMAPMGGGARYADATVKAGCSASSRRGISWPKGTPVCMAPHDIRST